MYTYKVEQAIKAAAVLHESHTRKGALPIPYITHLMAVTFILRDYTSDEKTLVAALLHDTLEDTDYTTQEITSDFGQDVTDIVETLTVSKTNAADGWLIKKRQLAKQLKSGPEEAILIAAADNTHNFRTIVDEYHDNHNKFIQDYGPNIEDRIIGSETIANVINSRLKDGIVHEFNHTFELYKQFLIDVQETKHK